MPNPVQHGGWIPGLCLRGMHAALGFAAVLALVNAAQPTAAQTFTVLYTFTGGADGGSPPAGVIRDHAGNLYGTTFYGGTSGAGTVFKVDTSGEETVLYSFAGGSDGDAPSARLLLDETGDLYGTTYVGGKPDCGTVFKLTPTGRHFVLHSFTGGTSDGQYPGAGLIRDEAGNLYGTTFRGGRSNGGTVFKLDASGKETVLHSFPEKDGDGFFLWGGVVRDSAGYLYGPTYTGGAYDQGTVFKVSNTGKETVLHSFGAYQTDGASPYRGLIWGGQGLLYGVTIGGGAYNHGTVFKLSRTGEESLVYSFTGGADGGQPESGLTRDDAGNLYGTTYSGGAYGYGVVFKVTKSGKETTLYSFTGGADGSLPNGLTRDAAGNLYGTTREGGVTRCFDDYGCGVVFKITP